MKKNIIRAFFIVFLLGISLSPSSAMGQFFFMEKNLVGQQAEDFTLSTLAGEQANFTKLRDGKNAVIFFWATWCPHCRTQLKELSETYQDIEKQGIKLILVNQGEKEAVIARYMKKNNINLPILLDIKSSLADPYDLVGLPTFIFVDKNGIILDVTHSLPKSLQDVFKK